MKPYIFILYHKNRPRKIQFLEYLWEKTPTFDSRLDLGRVHPHSKPQLTGQ